MPRSAAVQPHFHVLFNSERRTGKNLFPTAAGARAEILKIATGLDANPLSRRFSNTPDHVTGYVAGVGAIDAEVVSCTVRHQDA